jgi:hypothetical protein
MRLTANQFILAPKPLEDHDQSSSCNWTLACIVTSPLTRGWVCLLRIGFAFVKLTYRTLPTVSLVNIYWSSPAQSFLVSDPLGPTTIFLFFTDFHVFWNGASSSTRGGSLTVEWGVTLLSLFHSLTDGHPNWPCISHLDTDRVENVSSIIAVFCCCRGNMRVWGAVT